MGTLRIVFVVAVAGAAASSIMIACVGDTGSPIVNVEDASPVDSSSGSPDTGGGGAVDAGGGGTDAGSPTDSGAVTDSSTPVKCIEAGIQVFPPKANFGPFCGAGANPDAGGNGNTCYSGDHCCIPPGAAHQCAPTCTGGGGDFQCLSAAQCPSTGGIDGGQMVCCTEDTVVLDTTTCTYPQFTTLHHGICQASCGAGSRQLCEVAGECGALTCVGATTPYQGYLIAVCQ
jgi:hypothetical protein